MILDIIKKRRSLRNYSSRPIPQADLFKCLEAARLAPSACNAQPWKFIVVDEPQLKDEICRAAFSGVYSINKFTCNAPVLIIVVSEREKFIAAMGGYFRGLKYYLIDIGIACEHLILQAAELGIGSCWLGWFNEPAVKNLLHIPRNKKVDVIISLGYDKGEQVQIRPKPRKPLAEISGFNTYR